MENEERTLEDLFGQTVAPGDFVIAADSHTLALYRVLRITPKMIRVVNIKAKSKTALKGKLRYPQELFKIEEHMATFYLMKCR